MLGATVVPVVECLGGPATREESAMPSPVFSIPRASFPPDHESLGVPHPRGPRAPTLLADLDLDLDDDGTPLAVTVEDRGGVYVVHVDGEVDLSTAPLLDGALEAGLSSGRPTVVVDLRRVSFVDCTGIGLLIQARSRACREGTRLHVLAGRAVARTAALLDLTVTLGLHETFAQNAERSA